jgi:hypothetical protein
METQENTVSTVEPIKGEFFKTLVRNNATIRKDRAEVLAKNLRRQYKNQIDNMIGRIEQLRLEQQTLIDLSPTTKESLVFTGEFNSESFIEKDMALLKEIRNTKILMDEAITRFEQLFGEKYVEL